MEGFIGGEMRRYLRLSSSEATYYETLSLLFKRLSLRAYRVSYLRNLFANAPSFGTRERLLFPDEHQAGPTEIPITFKLRYSSLYDELGLGKLLRDDDQILPPWIASHRRVVCYKRATTIASKLKTQNFPAAAAGDLQINDEPAPTPQRVEEPAVTPMDSTLSSAEAVFSSSAPPSPPYRAALGGAAAENLVAARGRDGPAPLRSDPRLETTTETQTAEEVPLVYRN